MRQANFLRAPIAFCERWPQFSEWGVVRPVGVEKLVFCTNALKSGDRKCPPGPRRSFVGHPGAMNLSRTLRE
jgi:hypothetical protein